MVTIFKWQQKPKPPKDHLMECRGASSQSQLPLPPELIALILSNVTELLDLVSLCLVCKVCYFEGIRMLYRHVELLPSQSEMGFLPIQRWFEVVAARPRIASLVHSLKIDYDPWSVEVQKKKHYKQWVESVAKGFASLSNLKQ
jgi:hypothetical protein